MRNTGQRSTSILPPPGANKAGRYSVRSPTTVIGPVGGVDSQRRETS